MENMPIHVKIRIAISMGLTTILFAFLGFPAIRPEIPGDQLRWFPDFHITSFLVAACLCMVVPLTGIFAGRIRWRAVGSAAIPFGLVVWAIQSGGMDKALVGVADVIQRKSVFWTMVEEVIVWTALVWLGYLSAKLIYRQSWKKGVDFESGPSSSAVNREGLFGQPWVMNVGGVFIVQIVGLLLLYVFLQSSEAIIGSSNNLVGVTFPAKGQIIFAVFLAFFVSALLANQFLGAALWPLLLTPSLIAIMVYFNATREDTLGAMKGIATHFNHADLRLAVVSPLMYISVGWMGIMAGYFTSIRTGKLRNLFM